MTPEGIEPSTFGFGIRRATNYAMESKPSQKKTQKEHFYGSQIYKNGVSGFRSQYLVVANDARFRLRQYPGCCPATTPFASPLDPGLDRPGTPIALSAIKNLKICPLPTLHCTTQRSVQNVLIFRLLLKITVDWPLNAIFYFVEPERAPTNSPQTKKKRK